MQTSKTGQVAIAQYCPGGKGVPCMSSRPEFYSGRGVSHDDLGVPHLKAIHEGLVRDYGDEAGVQFCLMIESLKDLTATNFLNQFYYFFDAGQVWKGGVEERSWDVGPDDGTDRRMAIGMATVFGALSGKCNPKEVEEDSLDLKIRFFDAIGYEPTVELGGGRGSLAPY